jgi:uncharacterized membrane protein
MPWSTVISRIGRVLFALAIFGIGVETLICVPGHKVVPVIPWIPAIPSIAYPIGVIFILCGPGLLFQRSLLVSSFALGVVMLLCGLAFDVPRHFDLMSVPWRTNVLEPIVIGCLAWLASVNVPAWLHQASRYFVGFALIVFGIGHFQVLTMIANMVPGWIPWHVFWTSFFGVAFIAAGISFASGFLQRWAALAAGLMFVLWVLTIHLPALLAKQIPDNWSDVFIVVALCGGFWAVLVDFDLQKS